MSRRWSRRRHRERAEGPGSAASRCSTRPCELADEGGLSGAHHGQRRRPAGRRGDVAVPPHRQQGGDARRAGGPRLRRDRGAGRCPRLAGRHAAARGLDACGAAAAPVGDRADGVPLAARPGDPGPPRCDASPSCCAPASTATTRRASTTCVDSYVYGFALQEATLPFSSPEEMAAISDQMLAHAGRCVPPPGRRPARARRGGLRLCRRVRGGPRHHPGCAARARVRGRSRRVSTLAALRSRRLSAVISLLMIFVDRITSPATGVRRSSYFLNWNRASRVVPSAKTTVSSRQVPAHDLAVFQTYVYRSVTGS